MKEDEQLTHFANELDNLVERFRKEYDISYASIIACLQMKSWCLCEEAGNRADEV